MKEGIDMMSIYEEKSYKKLDKNSKNMVSKAINKLQKRYDEYKKQNIAITNIFGDSVIIHDIIDGHFYVYKCCVANLQIRLLYEVDKNDNINVLYHFIKNNNNSIKSSASKRCGDLYLDLFKSKAHDYEVMRGV
jgi:mRNA-degrading endonuclease RelE of RelBE toxin-antitoxin system